MNSWEQEKLDLLAYYDRLRGRAVALEEEINAALNSLDVVSALIRVRRALEVIITELCERELRRERGTEPLARLIPRLNGVVSDAVLTAMEFLNGLGNLGAHPKPVTEMEVKQAFVSLARVLQWYVVDYKQGFGEGVEATPPGHGAAAAPQAANPYVGLDSFEEKDAPRFFGREKFLEEVLWPAFDALADAPERLLALVGPSGSGKSSVARAGLLPYLKQRFPTYHLLVTTPTMHPLEALARTLAQQASPDDRLPVGKVREFLSWLEQDEQGLRRIVDLLYERDPVPLVLLLDQFEEVFTLCQDSRERERYLSHLLHTISDPAPHLYLLLTLRSDFLAESQRHPAFNQALSRHACLVPVLDDEGLRRAITEPARQAGHQLDNSVVLLLMEQSAGRDGALPLLQHALTEIWQGLQLGRPAAETLRHIGGVGGALAGRAQAVYQQMIQAEQTIARRSFLKLVQLGEGGADTRRRVALDDLVAHGETPETVRDVLQRFADRHTRFLTFGQQANGRESVEITHDALIVHWHELKDWLDANRDDLRLLNRLEAAASHWDTGGRPRGLLWRRPDLDLLRSLAARRQADFTEAQAAFHRAAIAAERRAVGIKWFLVALLVLLTVTAVLQWRQAEHEKNRAENAREGATLARGQAERLVNYMLFELRDKLHPIGRLDLLEGVARKAGEYFESLPDDDVSAGSEGDRAVALMNQGDVQKDFGNLPVALDLYQRGLDIFLRLVQQEPANARLQHGVAVIRARIGAVRQSQGDLAGALAAVETSLRIIQPLAQQDPANVEWQHNLAVIYERIGAVRQSQGDLAGALAAVETSLTIAQRLAQQDPAVAEWQRDLSISHERIGDVRQSQGDLAGALAAFEASLTIRQRLAQQDPANAQWQRDLSVSHERIGDVREAQGDLAAALAAFEASLTIRQRLAQQDPANAQWQHDLSSGHERIGTLRRFQGDLAGALAAVEASLTIVQRLAQQDPANAQWQRDLSVSHDRIGDVRQSQGDLAGALAAFEASLMIVQRLAQQDPANAEWQRDLSIRHDRIGAVRQSQGDLADALAAFEASLTIRQRLAQQDPGNAEWQRDLSVSHERIGAVRESQGDLAGALAAFEASLTIRQRLVQQDPANAQWQHDVSIGHERIGAVRESQGDLAGALAAFEASLTIRQRLAQRDPGNARWQRDLGVSYQWIGAARQSQGDLASALEAFETSLTIVQRLVQQDPVNAEWQRDLAVSHGKIGAARQSLGDPAGALAAFETSLTIVQRLAQQDPSNARWQRDLASSYLRIAKVLADAGRPAEARPLLEQAEHLLEKLAVTVPDWAGIQKDLAYVRNRLQDLEE